MGSPPKVPVSRRAVIQRLQRKLKGDHEKLVVARGRGVQELGDFYILDAYRNVIINYGFKWKDLDALARERGLLQPFEVVEEE